jgi:hypothetical protein
MPIRHCRPLRSIHPAPGRPRWPSKAVHAGLGVLLTAALAGSGALAAPKVRLYQVEVVVFAQPRDTSVEKPPLPRVLVPDPTAAGHDSIDPDGKPDLSSQERPPEAESSDKLPEGVSGSVLPRKLDAVARRLDSGGYRLLWHQGWVQPATERGGLSLPLPVLAALGGGPAQAGLSGTINLAAGRFLHLGVDLELASAEGIAAVLKDQRRLRVNEEHYIDHPHLGMVAIVTRLPDSNEP